MDLSTPSVPVLMGASAWVLWTIGACAATTTAIAVALIWGGWR